MLGASHGSLVVGRVVIRSDALSALALGMVVGFLGAQGGGRVGVFEVLLEVWGKPPGGVRAAGQL